MEERANKQLEELSGKIIKDASIESPSFNFTDSVMSQVELMQIQSSITKYKPLISGASWIKIILGFAILTFLALFKIDESSVSWLTQLNVGVVLQFLSLENLFSFSMSKTMSYSIALFCLMVCIQILFLKNHFNQRLKL